MTYLYHKLTLKYLKNRYNEITNPYCSCYLHLKLSDFYFIVKLWTSDTLYPDSNLCFSIGPNCVSNVMYFNTEQIYICRRFVHL